MRPSEFRVGHWFVIWIVLMLLSIIIINSIKAYSEGSFDHEQCQYPARPTNPPDGCDNTDPANPETDIKGVSTVEPEPEPITPVAAKHECVE